MVGHGGPEIDQPVQGLVGRADPHRPGAFRGFDEVVGGFESGQQPCVRCGLSCDFVHGLAVVVVDG